MVSVACFDPENPYVKKIYRQLIIRIVYEVDDDHKDRRPVVSSSCMHGMYILTLRDVVVLMVVLPLIIP